jgi:hypothetical protein
MHAPDPPTVGDGGYAEAVTAEPWALLGEALEEHWRGERGAYLARLTVRAGGPPG